MATNLHIDQKLLAKAVRLGGRKTKRDTVNEVLAEYIQHRQQLKALELAGTIDFDPAFDYKAYRRGDCKNARKKSA